MQHSDDGAQSTPEDRTPGAPHPDEGTIHAWLDDELPVAEADALRTHLEGCAGCRDAVAEARGLVAASARILRALDDGPGGVRGHSSTPPAALGPPGGAGPSAIDEHATTEPTTLSARPVAHAAGDAGVRSIGEARSVRADGVGGRGRRWRLPAAIAAVGLMAVGTTLVMQRSGPLTPLTEERSTAATTTTAPPDALAATDSLAGRAGAGGTPESAAAAAATAGAPAAAAAKAAVAGEERPTAPAVAVPPRPPQSADVAVAASPAVPDSATSGARSAFASPLQVYSGRAARAGQAGVAGAPLPVAAEASPQAVREVGPVLTGRVLSTAGEPIGQALVTVAGTRNATVVTDVEGRFRLAGMPAGEHTAIVRRLGFEPARLPLRVARTGDSVVTIALVTSSVALGEVVATGVATAPRPPEPAAESVRRAIAARTAAPSIIGVPANPVAVAPSQQLAGCYRLEIGGAAGADRDSAEAALPGWLQLLATPATGRPGWLSAEPLLPARRDTAGTTGWRIGEDEEVEIVWPTAAAGREVVLRLRGSGEVLTGTAALRPLRPAGGALEAETEAASVVAVRGVCAR